MTDGFGLEEIRTEVVINDHDGVAEIIDEKDEQITEYEDTIDSLEDERDELTQTVETFADTLEVEDDDDPTDALETFMDAYEQRTTELINDRLDELEGKIAELTDLVDAADGDELRFTDDDDPSLDAVKERITMVDERLAIAEDAAAEVATVNDDAGSDDGGMSDEDVEQRPDGSFDLRRHTK
jgi:chromosome segregation ATPase